MRKANPSQNPESTRRILRLEDMTAAEIQEMLAAEIPAELRYDLADIPETFPKTPAP